MRRSWVWLIAVLAGCALDLQAQDRPTRLRPETPTKKIVYKKVGERELQLHIFEPAGHTAGEKRPAIIFFHGGRWTNGSPSQLYPQCAYLAKRGMWAASAQYRLIPQGVKVADCVEDAQAAVRYVRAQAAELGVDADRIAAGGGSSGGHLAAATALVPARNGGTLVSCRPNLLVLFNPALFHQLGQQTLVLEQFTQQTPPGVQFYGTADRMVSYGKQCVERAKTVGFSMQVYTAADVGHGFFNDQPWLDQTLYQTDLFLAEHGYVQGEPAIKLPDGSNLQEMK